jgi:uncharacterized protein (TIGR02145 family)
MLPAAGFRFNGDGSLLNRGIHGNYWTSTRLYSNLAWDLYFYDSGTLTTNNYRTDGNSVRCIATDIAGLSCGAATLTGTLTSGVPASGVSASVPYVGGDGSAHSGQITTSTSSGATGLTATLLPGNFSVGSGNLVYNITGTPSGSGAALFVLDIGGHSCLMAVPVAPPVCRAKVNATDYKEFLCYNLGVANTDADPFTPGWEINGGYWQWGRLSEAVAGPTGASDSNDGAVSGWNTADAPNDAWTDGSKTGDDPCPAGYRIPTKAQWEGVIANNINTNVGTFNDSATNYGAGKKFGDDLMLPAAGFRFNGDGSLLNRGIHGNYWTSTRLYSNLAWDLYFYDSGTLTTNNYRTDGNSVRCIAE